MFVSIAKKLLPFLSAGPRGVSHGVKTDRGFLHTIKRKKANCIGRNVLLKHFVEIKVEGRIEVKEDEEEGVSS